MDKKQSEKLYYQFVADKVAEFNGNGKMTVAIFCDAFFPRVDGVINVIDNLANGLKERCNVVVFVPKSEGVTYRRDYLVVGFKSFFVKSINYDVTLFPTSDKEYKKIINTLRIDVIHGHSPFFIGKAAAKLHKKKNIPFVMTFHSQYKKDIYKSTHSKLLTKILLKYVMSAFNRADEVWTMHRMSAETLQSYGYNGKIKFVPNATDYVYPSDADERKKFVREHYALTDEKVFLFVGRLIVQKNILFIAEVLGDLKRRGLKFKMFFIGDGPDRCLLEKKIAAENVGDECIMLGKINDKFLLEDYYLTADMLLFPSKYDVSSIIQIEAAAMKTPCAFVEGSVTSCTVTDGVNGLILPEDVKSYADGVYSTVTDAAALSDLSANAYRDLYVTWGDVVEKCYLNYSELINAKKR